MTGQGSPRAGDHGFLAGGGELGARMRGLDWTASPLGPVDGWSQALRTCVNTCLGCAFPIVIWWGPRHCIVYNDEYRSMLGPAKDSTALGKPGEEVWSEVWDTVGPMLRQVVECGEATRSRDLFLPIVRRGFGEEAYFSFSYSPIHDDDGRVGGVFCPVIETTDRVIGERRLRTLRDLASACRGATNEDAVLERAARVLQHNLHDVPFAMLYRVDEAGHEARLIATSGVAAGTAVAPDSLAIQRVARPPDFEGRWPTDSIDVAAPVHARDLAPTKTRAPTGAWKYPPRLVMVCPISVPGVDSPVALLVAGVSPMRALDDGYATFFDLVASQVGSGLADARALEEERRRGAALAELDRAKTAFFSNVSHEFRTPLSLMIGPIEELLASTNGELSAAARQKLEVAHRNSQRLLRLVNTMLDFSRIEAGRATATYQRTDLAALTAELSSSFRSACESAGLELVVDCPRLDELVHVDREMWEKIVLNLVSNAFKFTLQGRIDVKLERHGGSVVLTVADTGVGIPADELPRMFERFHRVETTKGRTQEGTGIGLALVRELARLHGGEVKVDSEIGRGSRFTVSIPFGAAHLDRRHVSVDDEVAVPSARAATWAWEARRWLPENATERGSPDPKTTTSGPSAVAPRRPRVVWADDNNDLRAYVNRLLGDRFEVESCADGAQALAACLANPPDVVLTDVMMPVLDGIELLRGLRANPSTAKVPVILLSARAGEESRLDGIAAGADDYIVKPFNATELVTRVENQARLGKMRGEGEQALRASEERYRSLADDAPVLAWTTDAHGMCTYLSKSWYDFTGQTPATGLGEGWLDAVHADDRESSRAAFKAANAARRTLQLEYRLLRRDGQYRWMVDAAVPRTQPDGEFAGYMGAVIDITERKRAELELGARTLQYQTLLNQVPLGVFLVDANLTIRDVNPVAMPVFGEIQGGVIGRDIGEIARVMWNRRFADEVEQNCRRVLATGEPHLAPESIEFRRDRQRTEYYEWRLDRITMPDGRFGVVCYFRDIASQVQARLAIAESLERERTARAFAERASKVKDEFLSTLSHELRTPLNAILGWSRLLKLDLSDTERARHAVDVIERNGRQQARLIADILDMSRLISGRMQLELVDVDLPFAVAQAVDAVRPAAEAKGIRMQTSGENLRHGVRGDAARLQQIVWNLVSNAVKFTPRDGRIEIAVENAPNGARIRVTDNGEGIAAEFLPSIFDRFTQAEGSTTRRHGGLGIGLALVKELVELHGGQVAALSTGKGRGSSFVVELPWASRDATATGTGSSQMTNRVAAIERAQDSAEAQVSLRGTNVLVVDDEPDARALVRRILESSSATVRTCGSAAEALELLADGRFHVLVSDIGMPDRDGYELIQEVRRRGMTTPAVALTAYARPEDQARAIRCGYQAHVTKPLDTGQLLVQVAALAQQTSMGS